MHRRQNISGRVVRSLTCAVALFALVLSGMPVAAQEGTPAVTRSLLAELGFPDLMIATDGADFDVPAEIEAGRYRVVLQNDSEMNVDLEVYQLPEGATVDDILAAYATLIESGFEQIPDIFFAVDFNGGPTAGPGKTGDVVLDLTPGEWVINLFAFDEETQKDIIVPKPVTVTGEMPDLEDPAGAVEIGMVEMDFVVPEPIAAGPQVWKIVNNGKTGHHLILSQVPAETTEEQIVELASRFSGSAPTEAGATPAVPALNPEDTVDVAKTQVISSGRANWLAVDLPPGTYAVVCYLPDQETGLAHVMLSMVEVFTVSA